MRTLLALVAALALAETGWAADTDVENPAFRDLPLHRSPIYGGKQHQPTQAEVTEREPPQVRAKASDVQRQTQDLYDRVLKQSQQATPRSIDPSQ
jgi:hypothetical protein